MEKLIKKIKPKYYPIVSFALVFLTCYVALSLSQVLSTGRFIILSGDQLNTYVPMIKAFYRDILTGNSTWYSFDLYMGMNTSLVNAYYVLSPFNVLFLLLWWADDAFTCGLIIILKSACAAAAFNYFANKNLKVTNSLSIVFSIFYGLCSYQIVYCKCNIMWSDAIILLPLIFVEIEKLIKKKKWILLSILYALLFISNFYMGYIVGVVSFIYFIVSVTVMMLDKKGEEKIDVFRTIGRYFISVVVSVMISAIVWLPALMFILRNGTGDVTPIRDIVINILDVYNQFFYGQFHGTLGRYPYVYVGIPAMLAMPFFFISKDIKVKDKIVYGILLVFLCLACFVEPLYYAMHAFDMPDSFGYRFSFCISFVVAAMGVIAINNVKKIKIKWLLLDIVISSVIYVILMLHPKETNGVILSSNLLFLLINIVIMLIWIYVYYFKKKVNEKNVTTYAVIVISLAIIEMGSSIYLSFYKDAGLNPDMTEREWDNWNNSIKDGLKMVKSLEEGRDDFYRIYSTNDIVICADTYYGFNGMFDFSSAQNLKVRKTMENLGFMSSHSMIMGYGITDITKMLFNVRYDIYGVHPETVALSEAHPGVVTNNEILNLGYMVDESTADYSLISGNPWSNNNSLLSAMTGEDIKVYDVIDDVDILTDNVDVLREDNKIILKRDSNSDYEDIVFTIPSDDREAYLYIDNDYHRFILGSAYYYGGDENSYLRNGYLSTPFLKKMELTENGYVAGAYMDEDSWDEMELTSVTAAYLNVDELTKAYDALKDNQFEVSTYKDGYIKGKVTADGTKDLLFMSIAYDENWKAYVDGEETEIIPVIDDTFMGIKLNEGEHEVLFKYKPYGVLPGAILSIAGLGIIVLCGILGKSDKKKKEEIDGETVTG